MLSRNMFETSRAGFYLSRGRKIFQRSQKHLHFKFLHASWCIIFQVLPENSIDLAFSVSLNPSFVDK